MDEFPVLFLILSQVLFRDFDLKGNVRASMEDSSWLKLLVYIINSISFQQVKKCVGFVVLFFFFFFKAVKMMVLLKLN